MRKMSAGTFWTVIVITLAFISLIVVFAVQTWMLVDWLFPSTNLFMKIGTVGSFDVMAVLWAAVDMFYQFQKRVTKSIVQGMWLVCFALATAASVIQMYLSSTTRLDFIVSSYVIDIAFGLVILSLTVNLIALTSCFRIEWNARFPNEVVEDAGQVGSAAFAQIHEAKTTNLHPVEVEEEVGF